MSGKDIFDLSDRVALVTAAGHGLGREYCLAMAEYGADVACSDINGELAKETAYLVTGLGRRAIAMEADVSRWNHVNSMANQTVSQFGKVDILFCNAGIVNPMVRIHELAIEDWERVVSVNLTGTFLCMRAVLPIMLRQKRGSIICTSSTAGIMCGKAHPNSSAYGATKAGIVGLIRHAAVAYAKDGVRINAIAPGLHDTKPIGLNIPAEKQDEIRNIMSQFTPMGRTADPSEIKGLAVYLASDASSYVTGQVFVEDGGLTS